MRINDFEPGPWVLGGCSGRMITTPDGYVGDGFIADVDTLGNARLISAAPELLVALQEMIEAYDDGVGKEDENGKPWEFEMWQRAKAAVSKALGQ